MTKHSIYFDGGRLAYRSVNWTPKEVDPIPLKESE